MFPQINSRQSFHALEQENLTNTIITFWDNYLDFKQIPEKWKTVVIPHNMGDITRDITSSGLPENEFFVFEHLSAGRIISVHDKYVGRVTDLIDREWYNFDGLKNAFQFLVQKNTKILWPVASLYLFSTEKLLPLDSRVEQIWNKDKKMYDHFMKSCVDGEIKEVNMDFEDLTHRFFILHQDWNIVSLCNYSIDEKTKIAHIWIITPKKYQWNGYGKALVNTVVQDILKNNFVPQYRADTTNIASCKIAESLGFTPVLESYSFVAN